MYFRVCRGMRCVQFVCCVCRALRVLWCASGAVWHVMCVFRGVVAVCVWRVRKGLWCMGLGLRVVCIVFGVRDGVSGDGVWSGVYFSGLRHELCGVWGLWCAWCALRLAVCGQCSVECGFL